MTARDRKRNGGPTVPALATEPSPEVPVVLSAQEAADLLRVDKKTVYEAIRLSGLPARRVGKRRLVIPRAALLRWLEQGRVSSSEDD